jgi:nucleoporin SEH1
MWSMTLPMISTEREYWYIQVTETCSSDHKIKIWSHVNDTWVMEDCKTHDSSVSSVSWAHPEFGQLFVSCSLDKSIRIFELESKWTEKLKITSKEAIHSVRFAPNCMGLMFVFAVLT